MIKRLRGKQGKVNQIKIKKGKMKQTQRRIIQKTFLYQSCRMQMINTSLYKRHKKRREKLSMQRERNRNS